MPDTISDNSLKHNQASLFSDVVGWDIGGVNIKAARWGTEGWQVVQQPIAIWRQRDELVAILANISRRLGPSEQAAITITAELSDAFRTKREGIAFVLDAVQAALPTTEPFIFGVDGRFHSLTTAYENHMLVAAANWLATAKVVARHFANCLLMDVGSTTTDIIPIKDGQIVTQSRNDPERLLRGELLYTGVLRTPVFAIVSRVPLWGGWCPVAAELFATAQDVHLLLGHLPTDQCTAPSADGRPVTPEFARERLARMVCADIDMLNNQEIQALARYIATEQIHQITQAMTQVISNSNAAGPVVAVGVGTFLAQAAASQLALECVLPTKVLGKDTINVAPAAAVAILLDEQRRV